MKTAIENIWIPGGEDAAEYPHCIEGLTQRLLVMGSMARQMTACALQALIQRDRGLAFYVKQEDRTMERCEVEIDELVFQELSKGLFADELRLVTAIMKISHSFARVGDAASRIARQALALCDDPPLKAAVDVPHMAILSLNMLNVALKAFNARDSEAPFELISQDEEIDAWKLAVRQKLIEHMVSKPEKTKCCLRWMVIAHSLECIGDYAASIAEDAVFVWEGRNIKHTGLKGASRSLAANN